MAGPAVSGEVAWSVSATARQDRWLSKTEPGLQTRLHLKNASASLEAGAFFTFRSGSGAQCAPQVPP